MTDKLINTNELSGMLGVSPMTIFRLREKGMPTIKVGNSIRFDWEKVKSWMESRGEEKNV